ncbi:MAG: hypothetical protein KF900_10100 [Bacteroidetes bacterium]|nr:hypothetical protein [Bacteroidota bacterium]
MIKRLQRFFWIILIQQLSAQEDKIVFYSNNKGDFVCIHKDTIMYKIHNNDDFASFWIGKAIFKEDNKTICLKRMFPLKHLMTSIVKHKSDSSGFSILYNDSSPLFGNVEVLDNKNKKIHLDGHFNKNGFFLINEELSRKINNLDITVSITYLSFFSENKLTFQNGFNYEIRSRVCYPYYIIEDKKKVEFKILNEKQVSVKYVVKHNRKYNEQFEVVLNKNENIIRSCETLPFW